MSKKTKRKNQVNCVIKDWENKDAYLLNTVVDTHIYIAGHTNPDHYLDLLKKQLSKPESVVASKYQKNTKIANLKLTGERHEYLHVVIRCNHVILKFLGKKNYIVTFYGGNYPKKGTLLWKPKK